MSCASQDADRPVMRGMRLMSATTVLTLFGLTACSNGSPSTPLDTEVYQLIRLDGVDVPGTMPGGAELISGHFTLASDGTCLRQVSYRVSSSSAALLDSSSCHWNATSNLLDITWESSPQSSAELSGSELTLRVVAGIVCVTFPWPSEWIESYVRVL
jgi:hypothetical protein